jgi:hypothetical protein
MRIRKWDELPAGKLGSARQTIGVFSSKTHFNK